MPEFGALPHWVTTLAWTLATVAGSWVTGRAARSIVATRVAGRLPAFTQPWLHPTLLLVGRRLPLWSVLVGLWLVSGYWTLTPEARLLIERALFVVAAASITLMVAEGASGALDTYGRVVAPGLPVTSLTRNIAWGLIAGLGLLIVLNGLGISITPMLTALGVGGLAVALALQQPLANFFAGFFLSLAGQIRVGDYIKLDSGQEGYVVDFSWRSTRLRMLANNLVLVPNSKLADAVVVNHHLPTKDLAVLVEVGVDYESDLSKVEPVVIDVGRSVMASVPGGVAEFDPFIRYHTFADSSINFTVILRAKEFVDQYLVRHEFVKRLHARFNRESITIPFPMRTISYRSQPADHAPSGRADV